MADQSSAETAEAPTAKPHRHRWLIGAVFALATIIGAVAVLAVWTNRQALNTDNWTSTSSRLLADKKIQTALSAYLVNELFTSVDVQAALQAKLPPQLQGLAGPAATGLQQLAGQVTPKLLASSQVQDAWAAANRAASTALLKIINGGGDAVSTNGGVVTLNLHSLVSELAARLGIQQQVAAAQSKLQGSSGTQARNAVQQKLGVTLPPSSGQLVIMRSDQLKTVQDVASAIKGLAIVLPLLTFALFILAVWLSRGRRRVALRTTGWCLLAIGFLALLARRVVGNEVVDALVKNSSNKSAGHDVWTIGTSLLYDIGVALIVFGLIVVIASAIAGPTRPARALRRALAPTLRDRPVLVYGSVGFVYLLVIVWGPTPAFRQLIPLLAIAALLALAVEALRRQTAGEFADSNQGDTMRAYKTWYVARRQAKAHAPASIGPDGGRINDLERLAGLRDRGALTDAEYQSEKAALKSNGA
jgi:hypothetical protein